MQEDCIMQNVIVIGIAGGTGSGKSTMIQKIKEEFHDNITILSHDFYYKRHDQLTYEERTKLNYDHPDAIETDLMIEHVRQLRQWKTVERPVYDFTIHNRVDETVEVYPAKVVVVEGILIFENQELRDLCDIKVFIDTDADVRILRRILRDVSERGRTLDSVITQYLTTVKPMHEQFVEPSKKYADIIVPEGGYNRVALEMLNERIHSLLKQSGGEA
jgi:uridine kinase